MTMTRYARTWIEHYARAGFLAKGVVYLVLGTLMLQAAFGAGGRITGPYGAVRQILSEPYGRLLVAALAVGLAGYALWRFIEAVGDANRKGAGAKSVVARAGYALSGAIYGTLALDAAALAFRTTSHGGKSRVVAVILGGPLGPFLVVLVALGLLGYAVHQFVKAIGGHVDDELALHEAPRGMAVWLRGIVNFGTGARAIVFAFIGVLLLRAAARPATAAAVDATDGMRFAAALPNGEWWLAFIALGLTAYGVEQLVQAKYRRVTAPT